MGNELNKATIWGKLRWLFAIQLLLVFLIPLIVFNIQNKQISQNHLHLLTSMARQKANQFESWLNGDLVMRKSYKKIPCLFMPLFV
jgi:hypothetical protein